MINIENKIETNELLLSWSNAPWDTVLFNAPVFQIDEILVKGKNPDNDMAAFISNCVDIDAKLISARIHNSAIIESMLLEKYNFKFIEMVYKPIHKDLPSIQGIDSHCLDVQIVSVSDVNDVVEIADNIFVNERFYIDPRINDDISNIRFKNWIKSSVHHENQRLYTVKDGKELIAFFIVEIINNKCYWHLNAISNKNQGRGYGRRSWLAMIENAIQNGCDEVETCIVARNYKVLNLYASLGFKFQSPQMTFHWFQDE